MKKIIQSNLAYTVIALVAFTLVYSPIAVALADTDTKQEKPAAFVAKNKGDREGHDMTAPIADEDIPPAPVLTPNASIASMQVQDGFVVENVASEPLVESPITMVFDGNGRMWVAEMTTYMPDLDGNNEEVPEGTISILEDTDGDGVVDKRTVFLDDVILPRTISLAKGGILYADHEKLYFAEVLENDQLGIREVVDPTYAEGGNVEHKPNGMLYSTDNWYYNAKSNRRYRTLALDAEIPKDAQEIYRNQYWKMVISKTDNRGQWGISVDDYGRLYHNGNGSPAQGEYLLPGALMRNEGMRMQLPATNLGSTRVYPARINPGVNRAYLPNVLVEEGPDKGKLVNFTGAAGSNVYRGDQFPESFYGVAFTSESAANLITARRVLEGEGELLGEYVYPQSEILAATDERFRPVNLNTAPDGSLYIVDMYHGIIQHKEFLTSYLREQYESRGLHLNNREMGRIHRLRWAERPLGTQPKMLDVSMSELVSYLSHDNGWWRDTARQLLVQNYAYSRIEDVRKLALDASSDHRTKIAALWTLEGLNGLNIETIMSALADEHKKVRLAAIELSPKVSSESSTGSSNEFLAKQQSALAQKMTDLAANDYESALYAALSAGQFSQKNSTNIVQTVLDNHASKPLVHEAIISGTPGKEEALLATTDPKHSEFISMLEKVGKDDVINTNMLALDSYGQESYLRGKALYDGSAACFGCHGQDGFGINSMGPPLVESEWVTESPDRLGKILLHGLMGPISVAGIQYNLSMIMPGFASSLSDQDIADISTYVRNNWGNKASRVHRGEIERLRKTYADQQVPFTQNDFETKASSEDVIGN